jgi:hypothetical protein
MRKRPMLFLLSFCLPPTPPPSPNYQIRYNAQWGRRLEKRPNIEARLAGWRKMTQPGEICLMMDDSEGVPYRWGEPKTAKPVIESIHQLRGMSRISSVIIGELLAGGRGGGGLRKLCLTGLFLWPPGRKPWTACVHFHHTYSTDHDDLNHARKLVGTITLVTNPFSLFTLSLSLRGYFLSV